jgi:hypothetical protein
VVLSMTWQTGQSYDGLERKASVSMYQQSTPGRRRQGTYRSARIHFVHTSKLLGGLNNCDGLDRNGIAKTFSFAVHNTRCEDVSPDTVGLPSIDDSAIYFCGLWSSRSQSITQAHPDIIFLEAKGKVRMVHTSPITSWGALVFFCSS